MSFSISNIVRSWAKYLNHTEAEQQHAEKRYAICYECPKRLKTGICSACGCVLAAKTFSNLPNECPLGKWYEVDKEYFNIKEKKSLV
jgi:hypothetical protein